MMTREKLEAVELTFLAPYACFSSQSQGRKVEEAEPSYRTRFQRDRDRIIHSAAFRRMEYKTQVFVNHEGDHYRTRLTHSLEVAQIGRSVSRALQLNDDLVEALILSHDLGHTPFGHAGEREMSSLMKELGGFEHNKQSLRIVDYLEKRYPNFRGLNLSFEVREGVIKHSAHWNKENVPADLSPNAFPTLEAQLIDLVDEIAYNNHDIDDGLTSEMIQMKQLEETHLWKEATKVVNQKYSNLSSSQRKYPTISAMIGILVTDLIEQTTQNIEASGVQTSRDVRELGHGLVSLSEEVQTWNLELKSFLREHMYNNHRVIRMEEKAKRVIRDLFHSFMERPEQLPKHFTEDYAKEEKARMVCDYIAGMTDRFATEEHIKLFDPSQRV